MTTTHRATPRDSVILLRGLRYSVRPHFFRAKKHLLRGVDLDVSRGELFGFLGPNGAGKTTTIKALLGLLQPDSGEALLFGASPHEMAVRRRLGFMPERAYFPEHLTARELLLAHAMMAGLPWREGRARADAMLERVGLGAAVADERLGAFSKGMLQRVGLGQALIGDPELIILDEPMSGLDPLGRRDVRELMLELRDRGKTVFFSTHILPDVENICDRVAIMVAGQVRRVERLADVLADTTAAVEIIAESCSATALSAARAHVTSCTARGRGHTLVAATSALANSAIDALRAGGATIVAVQTQRRSLEQLFVQESLGAASAAGAASDDASASRGEGEGTRTGDRAEVA